MTADVPPLVELGRVPIIHSTGLGMVDVLDNEGHYFFYQLTRDGTELTSPIVRAINLHLIVPIMSSIEGMKLTADILGLSLRSRRLDG